MTWLVLFTFEYLGNTIARAVHVEATSLTQAKRAVKKEFPEATRPHVLRLGENPCSRPKAA